MSADPYKVLGVTKEASQEDIQKAYRALAKKLHPDLNPGNKKAEEQFKEVSAAYDLVGDAEKRARFDRGEIDASGAERPPRGFYRDHAGGAGDHYASADGFADFAGADDIFADLFGRRRPHQSTHARTECALPARARFPRCRQRRQAAGDDARRFGARCLDPAGTRDGQILRLRGKGMAGLNGGPPGRRAG